MGNTSETHKDKVTGVNNDGGVGDVDLKVHDGDADVSLIPAVVLYCGHVYCGVLASYYLPHKKFLLGPR